MQFLEMGTAFKRANWRNTVRENCILIACIFQRAFHLSFLPLCFASWILWTTPFSSPDVRKYAAQWRKQFNFKRLLFDRSALTSMITIPSQETCFDQIKFPPFSVRDHSLSLDRRREVYAYEAWYRFRTTFQRGTRSFKPLFQIVGKR